MLILCLAWKVRNLTSMSGYFVQYPPQSEKKLFHVPVRSPKQVYG